MTALPVDMPTAQVLPGLSNTALISGRYRCEHTRVASHSYNLRDDAVEAGVNDADLADTVEIDVDRNLIYYTQGSIPPLTLDRLAYAETETSARLEYLLPSPDPNMGSDFWSLRSTDPSGDVLTGSVVLAFHYEDRVTLRTDFYVCSRLPPA